MTTPDFTVTFLGTGTSQGVPVIGCTCKTCQSTDLHDKRLRTSIMISTEQTNVVIDCGPDFRQQMLREQVDHLEALVITHEHNDHIIGMDDVRPFNFMKRTDMPVYAAARVAEELKLRFAYVFAENPYPGAPMLKLFPIDRTSSFTINDLMFIPIEVMHGKLPVLGFRIGSFTYITDMKTVSDAEKEKIRGSKYLVVNALHHKEHHSHLNLQEALEFVREIAPEQAFLTHMSHRMGLHEEVNSSLPTGVSLAYDGLQIKAKG